ncbi:DNA polymerase [Caenorhabditis elegans]|uniref:DNA polymerase n=1 Tax=Caenorhabditis elegans TaxID=6239 RepID=Q9NAH1_CAEEL|nr:DNA polymerase [Caenorhabditis elegans]CAB97239.2 DNA polymerase [Caenorhabditis elegans]|eukprot:NP_001255109.1 DNA polymerase [Caenorhabditis elegans]
MSDSENHAESDVRRSSRRCGVSQKKSKELSAIEQLKLARSTGKAYRPELDVEDVYDTVDDDEYEKIVAKRQKDNFIVDDDGMGYVDNGVDFEDDYEDDYAPSSSKNSNSSKKGEKKPKKDKKKGGLHAFLSTTSTKKPIDESVVKAEFDDDEEVKNMLEQLGSSDEEAEEKPKATPANPFKRGRKFDSPSGSDSLAPRPIAKKAKREATGLAEHKFQRHVKVDEDEDYGIPDDYPVASPVTSPVKTEKMAEVEAPTAPAIQKIEETVKMETEHLEEVEDSLAKFRVIEDWTGGSSSQEDEDVKVEVKTGSEAFYTMGGEDNTTKAIRMYWIDAYEDVHKANGTVYLFGKVKTSGNAWETCSIVVKNICRKVYFMPRTKNLSTGEESSLAELHKEIGDVLRNKFNTHEFKCKMVEKELIRDESFGYGCGTKSPLMEVLYPAEKGKLPSDLKGDTFSNTFNTSVTPLERLLIEKKFMGPGWIELYNYSDPKAKTSNCKYEFEVDMEKMRNIKYLESSDAPPPTIKLLALNVVTTLNDRKDNEICMISMLFNPKCDLAHPSGDSKDLKPKCLVTKPPGGSLPYDIQKRLETEKLSKFVKSVANEKALLTLFLAMINEDEPDMIVGHDLSATIALLVSRLEKLKLPNWSRISRLKRSINIGKIGHSKSGQWELTAGRMMLDSKLAAMELVKSRSFDLTELSQQILGAERREIYANEIPQLYVDSKDLISLINWSWNDLLLSLRIVVRLNALPLYIQISQIVGGIASRTMMGGRAERNEYLLLHAFEKADLIAPDKYNSSESKKKKEESQEGDEKKSGKAQYSGGLVLEPKKGLYETLILLLDFNSLYPSIIQEYNICYTTLEYSKDSDEQLSVPQSTDIEGVLPREIRKLVECRRDVKSLMKSERNEAKKKQMDIRQMALKLTANSMYGCLGFQYSRFYAKPLAALVTAKGREILMHSKDLVEKMGYSVVYGDTDSIMINTNSVDLVAAKKLGNEIKKAVNKCHRLLELDLDGVFKRMLLLKKKKYAALTINPDTKVEAKELKGLDIVRRDWSQLAKETGTAVVDKILDASLTRDEMVSSIDDLLREIRAKLDSGTVPLEMFQISKQLTRNPEQYADVKAQCHAAVAQRLNKSGKFNLRHNDIVEYVICEDGTDNPATQRAYHRTEMAENSALKIDLLYYLAQQIHPVVSRLVEPIEETDAVRIAENLGLDSTNYRRAAAAQASQRAAEEDCAWHQENYDLCEGIHVICPLDGCGHSNVIRETFDCVTDASSPRLLFSGCAQCQGSWDLQEHQAVIGNQVDRQMSEFVARHHLAAFKCDEPTCEFKTRVQTMKWCREGLECIRCSTGVLRREYTSKQLFDQQMFFRTILDVDAAVRKLSDAQKKAAKVRVEYNGCKIDSMMLADRINEKYLEKNAYNRVDLSYIFAPMMKIQ